MSDLPDSTRASVAGNIERWTRVNREYGDTQARCQWQAGHITWGQSGVRETDIGSPLGDVEGLDVLELDEPQVPEGARTHEYHGDITAEWGRQWPAEEIWVARLR